MTQGGRLHKTFENFAFIPTDHLLPKCLFLEPCAETVHALTFYLDYPMGADHRPIPRSPRGARFSLDPVAAIAARLGRPLSEVVLDQIQQQGVARTLMTTKRNSLPSSIRVLDLGTLR